MIGVLTGWTGTGSKARINGRLLQQYAAAGAAATKDLIAIEDEWGISAAGQASCVALHRARAGAVAVLGHPEFKEQDLVRMEQEQGIGPALLHGYEKFGVDMLQHLRGQFALSLRDARTATTLVAADRSGAHVVYLAPARDGYAFSTSLEALQGHPDVDDSLDRQSIYSYLYFHVVPAPFTIFRQVCALEPGTYVQLSATGCDSRRFWDLDYSNEHGRTRLADDHGRDAFRALLHEAVGSAVAGAARPGCFLSGGTDSSTVAGVAAQVSGNARTYSIGFDAHGYDEMAYARIAARHFGTEHHEYYVTPDDVADAIPRIAGSYGQPFGNSSAVPTYYCARMARQDGVDRMLGGDGGDELFGGNVRYGRQNLFDYYQRLPNAARHYLLEPLSRLDAVGKALPPLRKLQRYVEQAARPMPERMESYNYLHMFEPSELFEPDFLADVDVDGPISHLRSVYCRSHARTLVNRMLALDYQVTLADNDLRKVGVMTGAAGVDIRYPLLDERIVDFASSLPVRDKVHGTRLRMFFKESLRGFLPPEILLKKKQGFGLPFGTWLRTHDRLREVSQQSLEALKSRDIVRSAFIDHLLSSRLEEHAHYHGGFIWILMMLEQWLQHHEAQRARLRDAARRGGDFLSDPAAASVGRPG